MRKMTIDEARKSVALRALRGTIGRVGGSREIEIGQHDAIVEADYTMLNEPVFGEAPPDDVSIRLTRFQFWMLATWSALFGWCAATILAMQLGYIP